MDFSATARKDELTNAKKTTLATMIDRADILNKNGKLERTETRETRRDVASFSETLKSK